MAQFQVYRLAGSRLVLDLQTDLIDTGTRVVAPLFPVSDGPKPIGRREPVSRSMASPICCTWQSSRPSPLTLLNVPPVADLTDRDYEIRSALDTVFSGI